MKKWILLSTILLFSALVISACSNKPTTEKTSDDLSKSGANGLLEKGDLNLQGQNSQVATTPLDPEVVKRAHNFFPQYPGATLDSSKGHYSKAGGKEVFNLVYYTDDSVKQAADFFHSKIAEEYLTEVSSPAGDEWVHMEVKVKGLKHSGGIFLRKTEDGKCEIIYMIEVNQDST